MPRTNDILEIPSLAGGVNRFEREAQKDQLTDALDVIADDGDLRRRDAMVTVGSAAPHILPCGLTAAQINVSSAWTLKVDRGFALTDCGYFIFGCDEAFDGIDVRTTALSGSAPTKHTRLQIGYSVSGGSGWTTLAEAAVRDETVAFYASASNYATPLTQDGRIYWHRSQFSSWVATTINSVSKFWIKVELFDIATNASMLFSALPLTSTIGAPGLRAFLFAPVNGLFPVRLRGGQSLLVVGSDRRVRRGLEAGAQLGAKKNATEETERLLIVQDEGAGAYGAFTAPTAEESTATPASWGASAGQPANAAFGASGVLTKTGREVLQNGLAVAYEWWLEPGASPQAFQWAGAPVLREITPISGSTTALLKFAAPTTNLNQDANRFEGWRLVCTTGDAAGVTLGKAFEVWKADLSGTDWRLYVYPLFEAAPTATNRFRLMPPPAEFRFLQTPVPMEAKTNTAHAVTMELQGKYAATAPSVIANKPVHWEAGWDVPRSIPAGHRWSGMMDPASGLLHLTNGVSGLLGFDGRRLRKMLADTTSTLALALEAAEVDEISKRNNPSLLAQSRLLSIPPSGRYIVDHFGALFVANMPGGPRDVAWSDHQYNAIWPRRNSVTLRDSENDEITGMATLSGELIVFTPTALFVMRPVTIASRPAWSPQPMSRGIGFMAHAAVCAVPIQGRETLIGPAGDGVYLASQGEPVAVLDDWRRLIDGGVNARALTNAVGAAMLQRNWYLLAVEPMIKSSTDQAGNSRILVFDWARKAWWIWTCPFSVSAMAVERDETGEERLYIGTDDGHVLTLTGAATDDGVTITGYGRSAPWRPYRGEECSFSSLRVSAQELGAEQTLGVRVYIGSAKSATQDTTVVVDDGASLAGARVGAKTYTITAATVTSNVCTATVGAHDVLAGVKVSTSGLTYNATTPVACTSVTSTTILFPLDAPDGTMADQSGSMTVEAATCGRDGFVTVDLPIPTGTKDSAAQIELRSSSRWRVRSAALRTRRIGGRGR